MNTVKWLKENFMNYANIVVTRPKNGTNKN